MFYVVGDHFNSFIQANPSMIGIQALLKQKEIQAKYKIGQGLSDKELKKLSSPLQRIDKKWVHKRKAQNVLITAPAVSAKDEFISHVLLDDEGIMDAFDHTTGQHVQGMVIIEAARQVMLAVTEQFLLSESERLKMRFILEKIEVDFKYYLFPLEIEIKTKVLHFFEKSSAKRGALVVQFYQNNRLAAEINIHYSVIPREQAQLCEELKVTRLLKFLLTKTRRDTDAL